MKTRFAKIALSLTLCAFSLQSLAQGGNSQFMRFSADLPLTMGIQNRLWEKPDFKSSSPQQGLEKIYSDTVKEMKSPQKLQKKGGMHGGGGNSLLCKNGDNYKTVLLDLYEAQKNGLEIDMGPGKSFIEKLDYVFDRIKKISPIRAAAYKTVAMNLLSQDTQWIENAEMPVIDDINITTIPRGCLVIQTAIQRPIEHSNLPNAKTYIIDAEIFNLLDEESKAALVLHEVLYREARVAGKNDSAFTRDLVGLFVSSKIKEFDLEKLNELMSANGISCSEDSISMYHRGNECEFFDSVPYRLKRTVKMSSDDFESPLTSVSAVLQVSYDGKFSSRKMKEIEGKGEDRQVSWQNNFEGFMWLSFKGKASLIGNSKLQLVVSRGGLEATYPHEWARIRALDLDWKIDGVKLVKKVMKKDWIDLQVQADRKANALEVSSFWVKCIEGYLCEDGEDNLLVFVGPHPKIPNQNGWHLTRSVKIRDNKPYSVCVNDGPDSGTCTEYVIGK